MKVRKVIETLIEVYKLDDELFITWWDKGAAEVYASKDITDTQWEYVTEQLDNDEHLFTGVAEAIEDFVEAIEEYLDNEIKE